MNNNMKLVQQDHVVHASHLRPTSAFAANVSDNNNNNSTLQSAVTESVLQRSSDLLCYTGSAHTRRPNDTGVILDMRVHGRRFTLSVNTGRLIYFNLFISELWSTYNTQLCNITTKLEIRICTLRCTQGIKTPLARHRNKKYTHRKFKEET